MRKPFRRSWTRLLVLTGLCFLSPFVFFAIVPLDFSPSLQHRQLIGDHSVIRQTTEKLNSIKQKLSKDLKVPTGIVWKDRNHSAASNGSRDDGTGGDVQQQKMPNFSDGKEQSNPLSASEHDIMNDKVSEMEDQLIMARTYLQFVPLKGNSRLARELKQRIKEIQRVLAHVTGSNLHRSALQNMRAMEDTLSKAKKAYPDCSAVASKLRAMAHNTEEQLTAQKNLASYHLQLAANTFPKGLHCLSMLLTTQYFALKPEDRQLPNRNKARREDLYHYALFSDNILACAVVVNSTVCTSKAPYKIVFHVVTDSLSLPAITMWFLLNPPGDATIYIQNIDDFKWLPPKFTLMTPKDLQDQRYISPLNHLRFYLPEVFPYLKKVLLLDHDVVVQKDLRGLWELDMKEKVIGVVETCEENISFHRLDTHVDFSEPAIAKNFDAKACLWAFGMNIFDLHNWRRRGLTQVYNKWLHLGNRSRLWKAGSLPLGQLTFYNHTLVLDRRWHMHGLGHDSSRIFKRMEIEKPAVIHYNGRMKPWLEIGIQRFRSYWNKFLKYGHPYLQQCNIHE